MMNEANGGYRKGFWTVEEDGILMEYVRKHGKGRWNRIATMTGLMRGGKSCRLRWINYLSPSVKRDDFTEEEDDLIIRLHKLLGNRWSLIAGRVPGRTDNQVKNYWNTRLSKKLGIKKEKNKLKESSLRTLPIAMEENFTITLQETNSGASDEGNGVAANEKELEDGSGTIERMFDTVQLPMNERGESDFWFSNGDFNPLSPDFVQLLDPYSNDFVWTGF